ncbi:PP2C family protein-serine/threonine phosphatase [Actinoalloteichus caeruleus]|uniref:Protein phosphatase n=1 Tax=Actinoalloteichus caeruleus DSM 43889 TaxID=1120930 RepID=A0ABT1JDC3_ACTCY|nr:PP2C family serine/threonine-protein phosphatase [Actinoalloteichus caeruleus]MCP2330497.1 protein phosphatase [Actinoalloteichus caeruleus DSM 43889]
MMHTKPLLLRYAAGSDVGQRRAVNQDSAYASPRLLAVADGMGGHAHGEVASSVVVATLVELDGSLAASDPDRGRALDLLAGGVSSAAERLTELAQRDEDLAGMGTTLTALMWDGSRLALAHVGDSRGYLLRGGVLYQITRDHTMIQSLLDEGRLTPEEAADHPRRSVVMRALQSHGSADPDLSSHDAQVGDRYLLCSDGLTAVVSAETVHEVLSTVEDRQEAIRQLIDLANRGGGPDNITCVVADVVESEPDPEPQPGLVVGAAQDQGVTADPTSGPAWLSRWTGEVFPADAD